MRTVSTLSLVSMALLFTGLTACTEELECGPAECAPIALDAVAAAQALAASQPGTRVTGFEETLLAPLIEDIRAGVRPFTQNSIGICRGERTCDEYLGTSPGELPPGKYIVMAELKVPNVGERGTWEVEFKTDCTITREGADGQPIVSNSDTSRPYTVMYAGSERGYRLLPLRTITSPSTGGTRACTYSLTAPHPDGDKVYEGSWSTPIDE